jgi:hypothetical protein
MVRAFAESVNFEDTCISVEARFLPWAGRRLSKAISTSCVRPEIRFEKDTNKRLNVVRLLGDDALQL